MLHDVAEPRDTRRGKSQKDARRFEKRGLASRIRPDDQIQPRRELRLERIEAAKMSDFNGAKHGADGMRCRARDASDAMLSTQPPGHALAHGDERLLREREPTPAPVQHTPTPLEFSPPERKRDE